MPKTIGFAIAIQLRTSTYKINEKNYAEHSFLRYDGDFESQTLLKSIFVQKHNKPPNKNLPFKLS